ncbi:hypothetical protein KJ682_03545 [bacterium]|nr:hypothetical protein [bacterium]
MDDDRKKPQPSLPDEDELRKGRKFDLSEAVARDAGQALKGASPVAAHDQTVFAARELIEAGLHDPEGSLQRTLVSRLDTDKPLVAAHFNDAAALLRQFLARILGSDAALADLVRDVDARWGREYQERPHFETGGSEPHPDDPYTLQGVNDALQHFREALDS